VTHSTIRDILHNQEWKNEKKVAIIRLILALTSIVDIFSYFGIISLSETKPNVASLLISAFLLLYSTLLFFFLINRSYRSKLKYIVICLDYSYVFLAFLFDPVITADPSTIVWYAFAGTLVFYLINLLRYSRKGTLTAMLFTVATYLSLCLFTQVDSGQIVQVGIALTLVMLIGYSITSSSISMMEEASSKQMMERYLPPQLVTELIKGEAQWNTRGRKQNVSIVFSDIRSFTEISEKIAPERVVQLLNDYLSLMTEIIFKQEGTIDKFIGDAIMTLFGAPVETEDDALKSVLAALEMQQSLKEFNRVNTDLRRPVEIGIGIHSGEAIAGNIGSEKRLDYTVIGDTVNIASRVEGLTKIYNCPILITQTTYEILQQRYKDLPFLMREIDRVILKGRTQSLGIYEVQDPQGQDIQQIQQVNLRFSRGLELYRNKDFAGAKSIFQSLEADPVSRLYKNRCEFLQKKPPAETWTGTHRMLRK